MYVLLKLEGFQHKYNIYSRQVLNGHNELSIQTVISQKFCIRHDHDPSISRRRHHIKQSRFQICQTSEKLINPKKQISHLVQWFKNGGKSRNRGLCQLSRTIRFSVHNIGTKENTQHNSHSKNIVIIKERGSC